MLELEDKSVLYILPPKAFSDHEFNLSLRVLQNKGIEVKLASITEEAVITDQNNFILLDKVLKDINPKDYDAAVVLGSNESGEKYKTSAIELIRGFIKKDKVVAGISLSVEILNDSGALEGKKITAHPSIIPKLEGKHDILDKDVVADENIVTARAGEDAEIFGERIAETIIGKLE